MLELPAAEISAWIGRYFWPFFRVAAFLMAVPVIGTQLVPIRIRLGLAILVTLVIVPLLPNMPRVEALSLQMFLLVGQQILIGVSMGFLLQLLFQVFIVAGQLISMQMGLGFASLADPVNGVSVTVLSQFYLMLVTLLFLSMNGHLVMIEIIVESFRTMPVALTPIDAEFFRQIAYRAVWMFSAAVVISLPAVTALLIVNFAFGVMNRAAPQFNVFSLGFPFTMICGLVIVFISLSGFLPQFDSLSAASMEFLREMIGG